MIAIDKLNVTLSERTILNGISLNIEKGRFYCIAGPNGSGKTTFLRSLLNVLPIAKGNIHIENQDITSYSQRKLARIEAVVPQNTYPECEFSAFDVVMMGRAPYLSPLQNESSRDLRIVKESMEITNTWHLKDRPVRVLSGGEKQRVIIARALAQQTGILLLDEPVSNLDIHHQVEILNLLKKLNEEKGITVIAVLHDLNHVFAYSHEVILFNHGELVASGSPEKVLTHENIKKVFAVDTCFIDNPMNGKKILVTVGLN
jgi:iron complex transport system ATP-binding protein